MAKRPSAWYTDPTKIIPLILGVGASIVGFFVKDALTQERVRKVEADVEEVEAAVETHDQEIEKVDRSYDMIQQDIGYMKQQQQQILEAIKAKR